MSTLPLPSVVPSTSVLRCDTVTALFSRPPIHAGSSWPQNSAPNGPLWQLGYMFGYTKHSVHPWKFPQRFHHDFFGLLTNG